MFPLLVFVVCVQFQAYLASQIERQINLQMRYVQIFSPSDPNELHMTYLTT